jgi:4-diphosphocytidyl-2-C-methyl-D-erythritol kinase
MIRVTARAKVNLRLAVIGRRPDGYHELEALVTSLEEPHDALTVHLHPTPGVYVSTTGPAAAGVPMGRNSIENLAGRAALTLLRSIDDAGAFAASGLEINLHKEIPAGAGLGGGSADAAATLVAANRLLELDLGVAALSDLAASVGSDVPFCLVGGTGWMRGRGELVEPLAALGSLWLVVAVPSFGLSTPAVYAAWDELGGPCSPRAVPAPPALAGLLPDGLVNDLEPAAEVVEPRLRPFRAALEDVAGAPALLAGSGSAHAVVVDDAEGARVLCREARSRLGVRAWVTRPAATGVEV